MHPGKSWFLVKRSRTVRNPRIDLSPLSSRDLLPIRVSHRAPNLVQIEEEKASRTSCCALFSNSRRSFLSSLNLAKYSITLFVDIYGRYIHIVELL